MSSYESLAEEPMLTIIENLTQLERQTLSRTSRTMQKNVNIHEQYSIQKLIEILKTISLEDGTELEKILNDVNNLNCEEQTFKKQILEIRKKLIVIMQNVKNQTTLYTKIEKEGNDYIKCIFHFFDIRKSIAEALASENRAPISYLLGELARHGNIHEAIALGNALPGDYYPWSEVKQAAFDEIGRVLAVRMLNGE